MACTQQELCDYKADYKLPKRVIDIQVSGSNLSDDAGFDFPYEFNTGTFPWGWHSYNYGTIQADLQDFIYPNEGTVDVYIDSTDGKLNIEIFGTPAEFETMTIDADGDTITIDFLKRLLLIMDRPDGKRKYLPKKKPFERTKRRHKFHQTRLWTMTSRAIREENPLCEIHLFFKYAEPATQVDHLIPITEGGAKLDRKNLMSICSECHTFKSGKEAKGPLIQFDYNEDMDKVPENKADIYEVFRRRFETYNKI